MSAPPAAPPPAASVVPVPDEALDFPVLYNPGPAVGRWYGLRRARTGRVVSVVLSVGVSAALWWFFREDLGALFWWVAGISLGISLAGLAWAIVRVVRARSQIDRLHEGLALGIGRGGVFLHDTFVPWTEVVALGARPGRLGDSPRLVLKPASGPELELPLDYLSHRPAALDGAVRALSGGRVWVDLARLDD